MVNKEKMIEGEKTRVEGTENLYTDSMSPYMDRAPNNMPSSGKSGGRVKAKKMAKGGSVGSASKRADGIAIKGKTRGKMC